MSRTYYINQTHHGELKEFTSEQEIKVLDCRRGHGKKFIKSLDSAWEDYKKLKEELKLKERGYMK